MSPEQALGKRVTIDHRADIYALGVSLYELLTTEPAFDGENRAALLKQIAFQELRRLRQIDRTIPHDLETVIHKAVTKNPDERYFSAQELANDLKAFRNNQPITARPPSIVDRSRKWVFRNQGLVLATGIVMLITTIGLAISNSLIASQRNSAQTARAATQVALDGEKKQREEAEKQADIAKAVIKFLEEDLLGQASPNANPRDSKLTVDELVDRAALKLDKKFSKQPHIRESLRFTIGSIFQLLGKYEQAQAYLEKALEFQRSIVGDYDKVTREYMNMLAINYQCQGTFGDRAESLHQSNLDYIRRTGRNENDFAITTLRNMSFVRQTQRRYLEAIALLEQAVDISRRLHGEEQETTLSHAAVLAKTYYDGLRFEDARLLADKTLEIAERVLKAGSDKVSTTCSLMNTLASLYADQGRFEEAMALRERIKESQSIFFGPEHPGT
ncbi:MAG TPA: tetratricopeptide repeat protein, partial [Pirellula sp.]|nr:tetratricopeptide repeat protein [Pirellula sp.]